MGLDQIVAPLLRWYAQNARNLPWRVKTGPYAVWVSEVMLQQTRIGAVMGHYARFLAALPDIAALAAVDEDGLLKLWEGLGYYSRARNLRSAARKVIELYNGELPRTYAELLRLPGFGEYTAAAVASIAFGEAVPTVDGNVLRVAARLEADYGDIADTRVKRLWREALAEIIPAGRPGDFNQALMELGETVCLPNGDPLCGSCPLAELCKAKELSIQRELPVRAKKAARKAEERTVLFLVADGKLLLFRRPDKGLLAGLFEPLNLPGARNPYQEAEKLGGKAISLTSLGAAVHVFTHREWRMAGWLVRCEPFEVPGGVWADAAELRGTYALPSAFRPFLKQLKGDLYAHIGG